MNNSLKSRVFSGHTELSKVGSLEYLPDRGREPFSSHVLNIMQRCSSVPGTGRPLLRTVTALTLCVMSVCRSYPDMQPRRY